MERKLSDRTRKQIRQAVTALQYIERAEAAGQDVSRLAEKRERSTDLLMRMRCCVHCGRQLDAAESVEEWSLDGLGPRCRVILAAREQVAS